MSGISPIASGYVRIVSKSHPPLVLSLSFSCPALWLSLSGGVSSAEWHLWTMSSKFTPFKFFPTQVHSLGEWKVVRWNHVSIFKLASNSFCLYLLIPIAGSFIVGRIISEKNRFVLFLIGRELSNSCPHIYDQLLLLLIELFISFSLHAITKFSRGWNIVCFWRLAFKSR